MRPAQQNRRMRGRGNNNNNNNNRKGPNPLSRNYESNGPDVKIRGNAQHIAEKYTTLARDAQASGDRVMAENYLQHAEHYNRIIMAAMAQNPAPIQPREESFDDYDDDDNGFAPAVVQEPRPVNGSGPQPVIEGTPAEVVYGEESGEATKSSEARGPRDRDNRRPGRGRRPQRERFNSDEQPRQATEPQPAGEAVTAQEAAPVVAETAPVKESVEAPVVAAVEAPVAAPVEVKTEEEATATPRRVTRRPGRPRRVAKDEDAAKETPAPEAAASDA